MKRHLWRLLAAILPLSMMLAACGPGAVQTVVVTEMVQGQTVEKVVTATPQPKSMEDTGQVFVLGAVRGPEADSWQKVIDAFEAKNPDINVVYSGTSEFETLISVRVEAGDPPDIAMFPQPGAVARFARQGDLVPLWDSAVQALDANYQPGWKDLGSVDGTPYGIFHRVNAKGWFWYNKPDWEAAGWQVPKTWDDMLKLFDAMVADGRRAPLCDSIASGAATGWKGTDWIENIMLRTQPVSVYDSWVAGKTPFSSPEVKNAWQILGNIWFNPKYVYGGTSYIATTDYKDSAALLFGSDPKCWLHMQGSFVTAFFPQSVQDDLDNQVGVFSMPPIDTSLSPALEVGGDQFVVFKGHDRPEVRKFIEFLETPESVKPWATLGGALFPHINQDLSWYPDQLDRNMAEAIVNAKTARFDGSDNMASATNLAFWKGITDWVTGADLDTVLKTIDQASQSQ